MEFDGYELKDVTMKNGTLWAPPYPKSTLWIGDKHYKTSLPVEQRFNWFQKLMWKWCFGVKIKDYKE